MTTGAPPADPIHVAAPMARQTWSTTSFIHWRADADEIQRRLPESLAVDTFDGSAWVGLTPFEVTSFRVAALVPFPGGTFPETNLRTYVRDAAGRRGLWFFSLDVGNPANAALGRSMCVPYEWSAMSVTRSASVRYRSRRIVGRPARHDIEVRPHRSLDRREDCSLV